MNTGPVDAAPGAAGDSRTVRREFRALAVLICVALVLFGATRSLALFSHSVHARSAQQWYDEGETRMQAGQPAQAVLAFRKAMVNAPRERAYALALAGALAAVGRLDDADVVLREAHNRAPDDADINLQLARDAAARHDVAAAARDYRAALYGTWSGPARPNAPHRVRVELARMFIDHQQYSAATSELIIASLDDMPVAGSLEIGELLLRANESRRAFDTFDRILKAEPQHHEAAVGAARALFQLAEYPRADRYFRRAQALGPLAAQALSEAETCAFITALDPLAARLTPDERVRRLKYLLDLVGNRIGQCAAADGAGEIVTFRRRLSVAIVQRNPQLIDEGLSLIDEIERRAASACSLSDATHDGLLLMSAAHKSEGH